MQGLDELLSMLEPKSRLILTEYFSDKAGVVWTVEDVFFRALEIKTGVTEKEAIRVLAEIEKEHDAQVGITWGVIDEKITSIVEKRKISKETCEFSARLGTVTKTPGMTIESVYEQGLPQVNDAILHLMLKKYGHNLECSEAALEFVRKYIWEAQ